MVGLKGLTMVAQRGVKRCYSAEADQLKQTLTVLKKKTLTDVGN